MLTIFDKFIVDKIIFVDDEFINGQTTPHISRFNSSCEIGVKNFIVFWNHCSTNFGQTPCDSVCKGHKNVVLHEADYTRYKKLAVWFGNESAGISPLALERSEFCVNMPMFGIIESLNLGTSSGIVFYEITKQRRAFQARLKAKIVAKKQAKSSA